MRRFCERENQSSLNMVKAVLNGMDAYLYVIDPQSEKILFITNKMKEHFHLGDDAVGKTCWKVFQSGFEERCMFCPVGKLMKAPGASHVVWEDRNTVTGRVYRCISSIIDWPDGRKVHLRDSIDITDMKLTRALLKKRLRQQELMSDISQSLTTAQDKNQLIYQVLKKAGEFMGTNQAFLSRYDKSGNCLECLYEWYDEDGLPFIGGENKWPISPDMDIYHDLTVKGYAAVNDYALLTHPNFDIVKEYGLNAFLNVPIEISGKFWGILGFLINGNPYEWSKSDILLAKLIAGVFSGVISRNEAEENLLLAKEAAERASKAKGDFLSRMSHEIRTPMNAIIGMTGIARSSGDPKKMEYCLERIDTASKHLLGLINDILDMSKIEANKLELSFTEFDFEKMLRNITGIINFRIEEKKQNLVINIDKDIPSAFIGDEIRLGQVIMNLLTNAVKFSPEGGTLILNARNAEVTDETASVLFEVIDDGIGISKEQQARLFNPFEQADGSISRKFGGTGLGLSISKGIVDLMNGRIWIESELGHGSKFSFVVKMKPGNGLPKQELADGIDKDGIRVLAVEKSPEIREYFKRVMAESGLPCDTADTVAAALEMIKRKKGDPYNFFFISWSLTDFDSMVLAKKIKHISRDNKVCFMISETDWRYFEKEAAAAGVDRFIFKPLYTSALIDAVNELTCEAIESKYARNITNTYDFSGHTLLVAEDVEINREIIHAILEETQISIDFAHNGAEAVAMFKTNPDKYSLILMDIQMPEMDGNEAARNIRAIGGAMAENIPIIAMTANVFREDVEICIRSGMNDHLCKPINTKEVLSKLDWYIHRMPAKKERIGEAV